MAGTDTGSPLVVHYRAERDRHGPALPPYRPFATHKGETAMRVLIFSFSLVLLARLAMAHQSPHPFSGNWVIIGRWTTGCAGDGPVTLFLTVSSFGTVTRVLLSDRQTSIPAALIITPRGEVIGSMQSGLRDSHDLSFFGMFFHERNKSGERIGAGSWFSGYGCEGKWTATQK